MEINEKRWHLLALFVFRLIFVSKLDYNRVNVRIDEDGAALVNWPDLWPDLFLDPSAMTINARC